MMMAPRRSGRHLAHWNLAFAFFAIVFTPLLGGCEVNPATGKESFTGLMSSAQEISIGKEQHSKILEAFGGAYESPQLAAYVSSIGTLLAHTSERSDITFRFTILNSPVVNAFALPGGYVYVTRGLVALADNEAQLAGVLAHEIGHVTARHAAQRYSQTVAANIGIAILGVLSGSQELTNLAGSGANLFLKSYSREHEFEADMLGVRYLSRAGFSTQAMASFLSKLKAHDDLQKLLSGHGGGNPEFNLLATHPRTAQRVMRARDQAHVSDPPDPIIGREIYFEKIDGLLYGDDPAQGLVRGRTFLHPGLGIRFDVPPGFRLENGEKAVLATGVGQGLNGARILFDIVPRPANMAPVQYLTRGWAREFSLSNVETILINGLEAGTGTARVNSQSGPLDLRFLGIATEPGRIDRFLFITPPQLTGPLSLEFRHTTYSFAQLSAEERAGAKPYRLVIRRTAKGETPQSLSATLPYDDYALARFEVLNGPSGGAAFTPGELVKLIAE